MTSRPTSVTVIAYVLIVLGILGVLGPILSAVAPGPASNEIIDQDPLPSPVRSTMSFVGTAVSLVSGYFMLRGRNWSRYMYVIWTGLALILDLVASPMKAMMIPVVVAFAIIAFFLFRPAANAFFAKGGENLDPQEIPSAHQIASVVFYTLAGLFLAATGVGALMRADAGIVKMTMMCFLLFPSVVCLAIGRWLSPGPHWKRDVGLVFVVGAAAGATMAIMLAMAWSNPEFRANLDSERGGQFGDYLFAVIWFGAWLVLGGVLILMARDQVCDKARRQITT